jgi:sodium/bile acid cotransporter 7
MSPPEETKPDPSVTTGGNPTDATATAKETTTTDPPSNSKVDNDDAAPPLSCLARAGAFYFANEFLVLVVTAILLARAYPPLGATYVQPQITATWIAVALIFLLAGLGLRSSEFANALKQIRFNLLVQGFNLGVVSATVFGASRALAAANILSQDLADGMVVAACLPMTINMVLVLTKAGGGDESLAIVNAAAGNLLGVFVSPVLILGYLGVTGDIDLLTVFYKLALRVVVPVALGQVVQKTMPKVVLLYKTYKKRWKKLQEYLLVFIVYTVFGRTFDDDNDNDSNVGDIFLMILFVFLLLVSFMLVSWYMLGVLYADQPEMRVMGLFGCTHKTVAMGVPLINAIYEDDPAVGLYTLPLLIWHPMQLVIGTFLAPRLAAFVEREKERLGIVTADDDEEDADAKEMVDTEASKDTTDPPTDQS